MSEYRQQPVGRRIETRVRPQEERPHPPQSDSWTLAKAWEWGLTAGKSITMRRMSDEPNAPEPVNPYRTGVEDE